MTEIKKLKEKIKECEKDLIIYQNPETRGFILHDINAYKIQIKNLKKSREANGSDGK